ncbi:MAG: chemotaxis protein CheW, partial [Gammaproteobacteria bacterium]
GSLGIESELGKGSKIIIKVPLTLAIMPTLMIKVNEQIFALPLGSIAEIFHLNLSRTNVVDGQEVALIRDEALPLFYLKKWLVNGSYQAGDRPEEGHVVVVNAGARQVGFVVDKLLGQEEVVIKPLGALLHGTKGIAGATITGDGRISLILDIPTLLQHYSHRM